MLRSAPSTVMIWGTPGPDYVSVFGHAKGGQDVKFWQARWVPVRIPNRWLLISTPTCPLTPQRPPLSERRI